MNGIVGLTFRTLGCFFRYSILASTITVHLYPVPAVVSEKFTPTLNSLHDHNIQPRVSIDGLNCSVCKSCSNLLLVKRFSVSTVCLQYLGERAVRSQLLNSDIQGRLLCAHDFGVLLRFYAPNFAWKLRIVDRITSCEDWSRLGGGSESFELTDFQF